VTQAQDAVREPRATRGPSWRQVLARFSLGRYTGVVIGLLGVCAYLWITEPVFMTWDNWQNIIRAQSVVAILAIGMTFVVLTGGIDLSVASMTAGSAMILGIAIEHGWGWEQAALVGIATGVVMGFINGFLIGTVKIPFFVVTLGTLSIYQSFALLTTSGETISLFSFPKFLPLADHVNGNWLGLPTLLVVCGALYLLGTFVLRYTRFGRSVYAVGSNPEAARLTGIKVTLVLISVYTIAGLMAGIAAVVMTGRQC
jgi:ribose transport system permease protein